MTHRTLLALYLAALSVAVFRQDLAAQGTNGREFAGQYDLQNILVDATNGAVTLTFVAVVQNTSGTALADVAFDLEAPGHAPMPVAGPMSLDAGLSTRFSVTFTVPERIYREWSLGAVPLTGRWTTAEGVMRRPVELSKAELAGGGQ